MTLIYDLTYSSLIGGEYVITVYGNGANSGTNDAMDAAGYADGSVKNPIMGCRPFCRN